MLVNGRSRSRDGGRARTATSAALVRRTAASHSSTGQRKNFSASAMPSAIPAARSRVSRVATASAMRRSSGSVTLPVWYASITGGQSNATPYTRQSRTSEDPERRGERREHEERDQPSPRRRPSGSGSQRDDRQARPPSARSRSSRRERSAAGGGYASASMHSATA